MVFAEFLRLVRGEGSAALVATHNERLAAKMDRVVRLHEGVLDDREPTDRSGALAPPCDAQSDRHRRDRRCRILLLIILAVVLRGGGENRDKLATTRSRGSVSRRSREALRLAADLRLDQARAVPPRGRTARQRPGRHSTSSRLILSSGWMRRCSRATTRTSARSAAPARWRSTCRPGRSGRRATHADAPMSVTRPAGRGRERRRRDDQQCRCDHHAARDPRQGRGPGRPAARAGRRAGPGAAADCRGQRRRLRSSRCCAGSSSAAAPPASPAPTASRGRPSRASTASSAHSAARSPCAAIRASPPRPPDGQPVQQRHGRRRCAATRAAAHDARPFPLVPRRVPLRFVHRRRVSRPDARDPRHQDGRWTAPR